MGEEIDVESRTITMHLETIGSRKALGAINAKLRAKVGRLERDLSVALTTAECADNYAKMFEECAEDRDHLAQCLKFARTTMAVVANNANLRGVEYRSLIAEIKRIDAKLASLK